MGRGTHLSQKHPKGGVSMALGKNGCPINEEIIGYCNSSASFSGWGYSFDSEQYDFVQSHVLSVFTSENEISIL